MPEGRVLFRLAAKTDVTLIGACLRQAHPDRTIVLAVILENWFNLHDHPEVQNTATAEGIALIYLPPIRPGSTPSRSSGAKAYQDGLHRHRFSHQREQLKARLRASFEQFAAGSLPLLLPI